MKRIFSVFGKWEELLGECGSVQWGDGTVGEKEGVRGLFGQGLDYQSESRGEDWRKAGGSAGCHDFLWLTVGRVGVV